MDNPMQALCVADKEMLRKEWVKMNRWYMSNPDVKVSLKDVCAEFGKYVADNVCLEEK
jgi:hypothetical protein